MVEFGIVSIGRNEGERLRQCLELLPKDSVVVYVDSGSADGSAQCAGASGAEVIVLDRSMPFTAARARNAGFWHLREIHPDTRFVQFVDGDCELNRAWLEQAVSFLKSHGDVAAVCGWRRERFPDRSIYNWLCEQEWHGPVGEVRACGGDVMMRANAIETVGGYRNDLIAGEEPELCVRLRAGGWRIWRLGVDMTLHDAAMTRFDQWWRRMVRSGYAFAEGAYLHGASPERYRIWESLRAWLWGMWLPLGCLAASLMFVPWGSAAWLVYPLYLFREILRIDGPLSRRATLALFRLLARFAESWGQIRFIRDRLLGRQAHLIEYK